MKIADRNVSARCKRGRLLLVGGCLAATIAWSIPGGNAGGNPKNPKEPQVTLKIEDRHAYVGVGPVDSALSYTVEESADLKTWAPGKVAGDATAPPPVPL